MMDFLKIPFGGNLYALPPLVVGFLTCVLGFRVLAKERGSFTSLTFFVLTLCGSLWLLCYPMIYSAGSETQAMAWIRVENAAVTLIPSFILLFALTACGRLKQLAALAFSVFLVSGFFFFQVLAGKGFVTGAYHYPWGYYPRYGVWGSVFILFFFSIMLGSLGFFLQEYRKAQTPVQKMRFRTLLAGLGVSYLGSVDFLPAYGIPLYPCGYMPIIAFLGLMAYGIRRYHLISITPSLAADQILKTLADGLMVLDREGTVQVANEAAAAIFGLSVPELTGKPAALLRLSFFRKENLSRLFWTGSVQRHEVPLEENGRERTLDIASSVVHDRAGDPVALVFVIKDVTERLLAEKKLRASENHYRLLAENVMDVIWTLDMNLKFTYVSPSVEKLRGYSPEEAVRQSLTESLAPASLKNLLQAVAEEQLETGMNPGRRDRVLELEFTCRDGSTVWTEVKITVLREKTGRPQGILGVVRDIRDRKKTEEAMRAAESSYADLFQATADPIVMLNAAGLVQSVNPAAERALGYHAAELADKPFLKMGIFQPNSESNMLQEFTYLMLGWQRACFDARLTAKDGSTVVAEVHPRLIRGRDSVKAQIIFRNLRVHPADRARTA